MVLQRDASLNIWGWAAKNEKVSVKFNGKTYKTKADVNGKWSVTLAPMKAGGPHTMDIAGSNKITLKDILIGDVWLCSGQSNMEYQLGYDHATYAKEMAEVNNPQIRQFKVPNRSVLDGPKDEMNGGGWKWANPKDIGPFTAVGYFFAKNLYEKYHVPVGLINSSVGGTPIEAWITGSGNFGNTAAEPEKGIVYVQTKEAGSIYSLKIREPRVSNEDRFAKAQLVYTQTCQSCHGADKKDTPGVGVSLLNIAADDITSDVFKQIVNSGKGKMPPLAHLDDATINSLYFFLMQEGRGRSRPDSNNKVPDGLVVDSGGVEVPAFLPRKNAGYPDDYTGPKAIYIESNNWGEALSDALTPAWSWVVAYDLNKGTIKWKVPLGNVDSISGKKNTGYPNGSLRKGMVLTATGLIFATAGDGRVYAYDADNGNILWKYDLGRTNPGGIHAMYEANGKQYLVVCSTGRIKDKTKKEADLPRGYNCIRPSENKKIGLITSKKYEL